MVRTQVMCWWSPSSSTGVLSALTLPNRRASLSDTSAHTQVSGPTPVRPVARGSLDRSTCGATPWACTDPTVQSSARAAGEPSQATCRRGWGASGCATAAPAFQTHTTTSTIWCPSTLAWWRLPPKAKRRVTQTMTGRSMWSLVRKTTLLETTLTTDHKFSPASWIERHSCSSKLVGRDFRICYCSFCGWKTPFVQFCGTLRGTFFSLLIYLHFC